jgi:hypothetical protein
MCNVLVCICVHGHVYGQPVQVSLYEYLYVCMYVCTCTKHLIVCVGRENNVGRQDREHGVMCARTRVRVCAVGRRVCTWIRAHTMFRFLRAQVLEKIWREWVSEQDVEKVPAL